MFPYNRESCNIVLEVLTRVGYIKNIGLDFFKYNKYKNLVQSLVNSISIGTGISNSSRYCSILGERWNLKVALPSSKNIYTRDKI